MKTTFLARHKKKIAVVGVLAASVTPAFCAASDVTSSIAGLSADASAGVGAGVTVGAVVFGAKVVWGAIKSMAS